MNKRVLLGLFAFLLVGWLNVMWGQGVWAASTTIGQPGHTITVTRTVREVECEMLSPVGPLLTAPRPLVCKLHYLASSSPTSSGRGYDVVDYDQAWAGAHTPSEQSAEIEKDLRLAGLYSGVWGGGWGGSTGGGVAVRCSAYGNSTGGGSSIRIDRDGSNTVTYNAKSRDCHIVGDQAGVSLSRGENILSVSDADKLIRYLEGDSDTKRVGEGAGTWDSGISEEEARKEKCVSILPKRWCTGNNGIWEILGLVLDIMTMGIGVLATIGLVISGLQWLTARDKEDQIVKAKSRIFNIVIGLLVWALMWIVLSWLMPGGLRGFN